MEILLESELVLWRLDGQKSFWYFRVWISDLSNFTSFSKLDIFSFNISISLLEENLEVKRSSWDSFV